MSAKRFYLVPAGLAELVLRETSFRDLQVYMALKHHCRGQIRIDRKLVLELTNILSVHEKTVQSSIQSLRKKNWIGFNHHSGWYFIRGFDSVRIIEGINSKRAYWFDIGRIKDIKGFVIACCYSELLHQIRKRRLAEVRKRVSSNQKASLPLYYPIALTYFTKVFKIGKTTAWVYRGLAEAAEFITVKEVVKPLILHGKRVPASQIELIRDSREVESLIVKSGTVFQQYPSKVKSNLKYKKRGIVQYKKKAS